MKRFQVFLISSAIALVCVPIPLLSQNTASQPPAAPPSPPSTSRTTPSSQDDDAARAAERKKRFDEDNAALENAAPKPSQVSSDGNGAIPCYTLSELLLSPNFVNMFLATGRTQRFSLFDRQGHKLTSQADWSIDDSSVADLTIDDNGTPLLTGKQTGRVHLTARVDSRYGEATINVISPEDLQSGAITPEWLAPPVPCSALGKIAQAVPSPGTPAPCSAAEIELMVLPRFFNLLVGRTQRFMLFDAAAHDFSSQAEWSVDDSSTADLRIENGIPLLTGKQTGTVHLIAQLDSRTREAIINVHTPKDLKSGSFRFVVPPPACSGPVGTVRPLPPAYLPTPDTGPQNSPQQ